MAYGSGTPLWGKQQEENQGGGNGNGGNNNSGHGGLNSRYQSPSYQGGAYQPPVVSGTYAERQTGVVEDSVRTQIQAEGTAQTVLSQMTTQRYQLQGARDDVGEMREATERAKRELKDLQMKARHKKRRLQVIIVGLGVVDLLLLVRLLYCGGSFFCRHW